MEYKKRTAINENFQQKDPHQNNSTIEPDNLLIDCPIQYPVTLSEALQCTESIPVEAMDFTRSIFV